MYLSYSAAILRSKSIALHSACLRDYYVVRSRVALQQNNLVQHNLYPASDSSRRVPTDATSPRGCLKLIHSIDRTLVSPCTAPRCHRLVMGLAQHDTPMSPVLWYLRSPGKDKVIETRHLVVSQSPRPIRPEALQSWHAISKAKLVSNIISENTETYCALP